MASHSRHRRKCVAMEEEEEEEEDRLSGLPDDLLHSILRGLQLKHAARTSALSRRWARQWLRALACSRVLDFTDRDFARGRHPARAAATVGRCLRLHGEHGAPLDVFRVALDCGTLGGAAALGQGVVSGWVAAAVRRGAREVEVDLTQGDGSAFFLDLPGGVFAGRSSLARLALGGFSLRAVAPGAAGLAGLRSLSLGHADVTDEAVRGVLASCRGLEHLTLRCCPLLASVSVAGDRLRVLELMGCSAVRELRVTAPALESFVFHGHAYLSVTHYDGVGVDVDLGETPALRDAYLSHLGYGECPEHHELTNPMLYYVAHARTLTLCSVGLMLVREQQMYDEMAYSDMPNLQELQLLMASLSVDDDGVDHVSTFFMFTQLPLLDRLFIRLSGDPTDAGGGAAAAALEDDADMVLEYEVVFDRLTLIKVVNFRGTRRELRLLGFLLSRAPLLEQLVLITVAGEGAPGDEQFKSIQARVSAKRKASPEARVTVCRPREDGSPNAEHTRLYHEE